MIWIPNTSNQGDIDLELEPLTLGLDETAVDEDELIRQDCSDWSEDADSNYLEDFEDVE